MNFGARDLRGCSECHTLEKCVWCAALPLCCEPSCDSKLVARSLVDTRLPCHDSGKAGSKRKKTKKRNRVSAVVLTGRAAPVAISGRVPLDHLLAMMVAGNQGHSKSFGSVQSRARGPRLMQALSGRAFESVRHLIDDSDWLEAVDNGEQLLDLLAKPEYYGKEELESLYQSMHKLFFSDLRKPDDDLPAFRSKFEQAVRKIKKHKVELPQEALGFLFLKQAKISPESFERLITMTNGDLRSGWTSTSQDEAFGW